MRKLFEFIYSELAAGRPVVSAVIVFSSGSTPRSTGSRMALSLDGQTQGTVGGGPGEALALREAQKVFKDQKSKLLKLDLSGKEAAESGMICGGKQEILLEHLQASEENINIFAEVLRDLKSGTAHVLYTFFEYDNEHLVKMLSRALNPNELADKLPDTLKDKLFTSGGNSRLAWAIREDACNILVEPISSSSTVFIAGAGHVGEATARLTSFIGFRTIVLDDRADFLSENRFPLANELKEVQFQHCFNDLEIDPQSLIVILTRGHVHDKTVLAQALKTPAHYIGMIGSRKKREAIYQALRKEGFSQTDLDRVYCPIGLSIGADTPEEIAVSIVAELIQERAKLSQNGNK